MTFIEAVTTCLQKKYAAFDGTASRSEFWWFFLFQCIVSLVLSMMSTTLSTIASLIFLVPNLAVGCRRLHDTDKSGWLQLLALIPILGWIALIVLFVMEGKPNRYGAVATEPAPIA